MAFINLLPQSERKMRRLKLKGAIGGAAPAKLGPKFPVFIALPVIVVIFLAILAAQFIQLQMNRKTFSGLEQKIKGIKLNYEKITELTKKEEEFKKTVSFIKEFSVPGTLYADKLSAIVKLLPAHIWLTNISAESKTNKEKPRLKPGSGDTPAQVQAVTRDLTIKGSATSLIEAEIITSITQFADLLKKEAAFNKDFSEIKLGPLQSDKRGGLFVMNFVIYCKSGKN